MKKAILVIMLLVGAIGSYASGQKCHVSVLSTKRDIFYFKVDKTMVGSTVEVFSSEGEMIFSGKVTRHRAMIDFYLENPGTYTIKLKKEELSTEFFYVKSSSSPLRPVEIESASASISLVQ